MKPHHLLTPKQRKKYNQQLTSHIRNIPEPGPLKVIAKTEFITKNYIEEGQIYSETLDNWRNFVGNDLFNISFPKSYKNENKLQSSCLTVMVMKVDTKQL